LSRFSSASSALSRRFSATSTSRARLRSSYALSIAARSAGASAPYPLAIEGAHQKGLQSGCQHWSPPAITIRSPFLICTCSTGVEAASQC
jgi:hypothetical protein